MTIKAIAEIQGAGQTTNHRWWNRRYTDSVVYSYSFLDNTDKVYRKELDNKSLSELHRIADNKQIDLTNVDDRINDELFEQSRIMDESRYLH